ncbi:MAG: hypothetical protein QQN63_02560 [Nitrosopumilus sp.]
MPFKAVFETALADTWNATDGGIIGDKPGDIRWEANKCYKCVISSGALDFVAGDVVGYVDNTGYAAHTVSGTVSETGDVGAGVAQAAVTEADIRFWVQVKGPATLNTTLTVGATNGRALTLLGANDLTLDLSGLVTDFIVGCTVDDANDEIICDFPF